MHPNQPNKDKPAHLAPSGPSLSSIMSPPSPPINIPQPRKRTLDFSQVRIVYESSVMPALHCFEPLNPPLPEAAESKMRSPTPLVVTAKPVANPVLGFQLPMMALMDPSIVSRPSSSPSYLSQSIKPPTQIPPP